MKLIRIGILLISALSFSSLTVAADIDNDVPVKLFRQSVRILDVSGIHPQQLRIEVLPLYEGKRWAITSRWDDNRVDADVAMGKLMAKYGYRATFYVNYNGLGNEIEKNLINAGHSIQSHSITHPHFGDCGYNKIHWEVLKSRIDIESRTNIPVNSFAFPFNNFTRDGRADLRKNIYRILRNSGYIHVAYPDFIEEGMVGISGTNDLPNDTTKNLVERFEVFLKKDNLRKKEPNINFNTHASWKEHDMKKLDEILADYANRKDFWYTALNQYGAYRFQYEFAKVENVNIDNGTISFDVIRPSGVDSNDDVALSLRILGGNFEKCDISSAGKKLTPVLMGKNSLLFSLPYPLEQQPPTVIDALWTDVSKLKSSEKFPFLKARLAVDTQANKVELTLKNTGKVLKNCIITYRFPLAITPQIVRRELKILKTDDIYSDKVQIKCSKKSSEYIEGQAFFVVQLDFVYSGRKGRLYIMRRTNL